MELSLNLETVVLAGIGAVVTYAGWQARKMAETVDKLAVKVAKLEGEHSLMMQIGCAKHRAADPPDLDPAGYRCHGGRRQDDP